MADPISIIGLVAGIVTFVDFGFKVISGSKSVRRSVDGMTPGISELDHCIKHIQSLNESIVRRRISGQAISEDEARIMSMVQESERLHSQLHQAINKLKVRAGARSKTLESGRVTLQSLWNHRDLQDLGKKLMSLDENIRSNIRFALQT